MANGTSEQPSGNSSQPKYVWVWRSLGTFRLHDVAKPGSVEGLSSCRLALMQVVNEEGQQIVVMEPGRFSVQVPTGAALPYYEGLLVLKALVGLRASGGLCPPWLDAVLPHLHRAQKRAPVSASYYVRKRLLECAVTGRSVIDISRQTHQYRRVLLPRSASGSDDGGVRILGYKPPWQALLDRRCGAYQDFYLFEEGGADSAATSSQSRAARWWPDENLSVELDAFRRCAKIEWLAARHDAFEAVERGLPTPLAAGDRNGNAGNPAVADSPSSANGNLCKRKRNGGEEPASPPKSSDRKRPKPFSPLVGSPAGRAARGSKAPVFCIDVAGRGVQHRWVQAPSAKFPPSAVLAATMSATVLFRRHEYREDITRYACAREALQAFVQDAGSSIVSESADQQHLEPLVKKSEGVAEIRKKDPGSDLSVVLLALRRAAQSAAKATVTALPFCIQLLKPEGTQGLEFVERTPAPCHGVNLEECVVTVEEARGATAVGQAAEIGRAHV